MNILFVDQFGDLGGGQQCLLELIPAITERGWRSFAAVPAAGELSSRLTDLGVTVEPIFLGNYSPGNKTVADFARFLKIAPKVALRLRSLVKKHRIDLVYANGPRVLPAAAIAAGRRPLVFHAHNYLPPGAGRRLVRASLGSNAKAIAVSQFVATYLGPCEVIPNGVADLLDTPRRGPTPCIGMVGRIAPEKGQLDFVEAARLLPDDWDFLIAGAPIIADPSYAETVRSQAAGTRIQLLGWQTGLRELYSRFDLLAVPSRPGEGFGRVIIEAFSAQVPVVAYESGGIAELIEDNVTGYLVRPSTPEAFAARVRAAIADPEGRLRIAREARARWQADYTIDRYRLRVTDLIASASCKKI